MTAVQWALSPTDFLAHAVAGTPACVTCPRCGRTSRHPTDVAEGYCGACHDWTSAPAMTARCGHVMPTEAGLDAAPRAAMCRACVLMLSQAEHGQLVDGNVEPPLTAQQRARCALPPDARAHAREIAASLPPLTPEQRDELALLLRRRRPEDLGGWGGRPDA